MGIGTPLEAQRRVTIRDPAPPTFQADTVATKAVYQRRVSHITDGFRHTQKHLHLGPFLICFTRSYD